MKIKKFPEKAKNITKLKTKTIVKRAPLFEGLVFSENPLPLPKNKHIIISKLEVSIIPSQNKKKKKKIVGGGVFLDKFSPKRKKTQKGIKKKTQNVPTSGKEGKMGGFFFFFPLIRFLRVAQMFY